MSKPAFDLGAELRKQLGDVPDSGTAGREQIEYIHLSALDADERNFYDISGVEELAGNIELIGLQQPLRVRPSEEPGRYIIVSGHRRLAALQLLADEGKERFATVQCIVEREPVSPALQELRLIYANSDTRQMSNYDIAKQAERVTELLYQLQEEGVEFPGRMRDHVAEACKVSKTKLSRLKVILDDLQEPFAGQFREGDLTEAAAYALARLPKDIQKDVDIALGAKARPIIGGCAENLLEYAEKYYEAVPSMQCPAGGTCGNLLGMLKATAGSQYSWNKCEGTCCMNCWRANGCAGRCTEYRKKAKEDDAEKKRQKKKQEEKNRKARVGYKQQSIANAKRLIPLIDAAGLPDKAGLRFEYNEVTVSDIRKWAAGDVMEEVYSVRFVPNSPERIVELTQKLHCTADFLLGLTDDPHPAALPDGQLVLNGWMPGGTTPREPCLCAAWLDLGGPEPVPRFFYWDGSAWLFKKGGETVQISPEAWMAMPEYVRKESET